MAIRVTQNVMYNNMVGHMQSNLSAYMESVQQGSSQKKINRPSDDPAGTYRVLTTRNDMVGTEQYQENVDTAKGWLNLADQVLSVNLATVFTSLKTLAQQASTGDITADQRMIIADQVRQHFGQILNLSNTQFEDMHLFGGHKYEKPAFQQGLAGTSWDKNWDKALNAGPGVTGEPGIKYEGNTDRTILVQFLKNGSLDELAENNKDGDAFQWSDDGGKTWQKGQIDRTTDTTSGKNVNRLTMGGVTMTVPLGEIVPPDPPEEPTDTNKTELTVKAADKDAGPGANNGTMLYIRPTAYYQGDDKDPAIDVTLMGAGANIKNTPDSEANPITATGTFGKNVLVRIDGHYDEASRTWKGVELKKTGQEFQWSYSTDGGSTWITATGKTPGGSKLRLPVPGGHIDYDLNNYNTDGKPTDNPINGGKLLAGMQANIHPSRADLDYEIMKDTYLSVNSVGKDVFGGYYEGKPALNGGDENLFEVVGKFIGYLEGNNQEGCQKTLAALEKAEKQVLAEATRIGGMENRLSMAADVLSFQKLDQQERLSYTEDIDLTELLTKLTRQQMTYQTVLQSSSMIMQLSLANYV